MAPPHHFSAAQPSIGATWNKAPVNKPSGVKKPYNLGKQATLVPGDVEEKKNRQHSGVQGPARREQEKQNRYRRLLSLLISSTNKTQIFKAKGTSAVGEEMGSSIKNGPSDMEWPRVKSTRSIATDQNQEKGNVEGTSGENSLDSLNDSVVSFVDMEDENPDFDAFDSVQLDINAADWEQKVVVFEVEHDPAVGLIAWVGTKSGSGIMRGPSKVDYLLLKQKAPGQVLKYFEEKMNED